MGQCTKPPLKILAQTGLPTTNNQTCKEANNNSKMSHPGLKESLTFQLSFFNEKCVQSFLLATIYDITPTCFHPPTHYQKVSPPAYRNIYKNSRSRIPHSIYPTRTNKSTPKTHLCQILSPSRSNHQEKTHTPSLANQSIQKGKQKNPI